jgi:hypothetical protein
LNDYQEPSQNWTSQHEGARFFGMGCAQLIRNLATHFGSQPDEEWSWSRRQCHCCRTV